MIFAIVVVTEEAINRLTKVEILIRIGWVTNVNGTDHFGVDITGATEEIWKTGKVEDEGAGVEAIEEGGRTDTEVEEDMIEEAEVVVIMVVVVVDTVITWMDHSQDIQAPEAIIHQVGQTENKKILL